MSDALLFYPNDSPGPNPGFPETERIYKGVLDVTTKEAFDKNGLYHTRLDAMVSLQTEALLLPMGMTLGQNGG